MNSLDKFVFEFASDIKATLSTSCVFQTPFSDSDPMRVIYLSFKDIQYCIGIIKIQSLMSVTLIKLEKPIPVLIPESASQSEISLIKAINNNVKETEIACVKVSMNLNGVNIASKHIATILDQ